MSLRDDVLIESDAIGADDLQLLIQHARRAHMTNSLVSNFEDPQEANGTQWVVNTNIRNTQEVQLSPPIAEKLASIDRASIDAFINPFYAVEVRDCEPSQMLHY